MDKLFTETELRTAKRWAFVLLGAFVVGAGDYLVSGGTGERAALVAGLVAAYGAIRHALVSPPSADADE